MKPASYIHPTAIVDQPCAIGAGSKIWHFVHIGENAVIGRACILGQNVMIAPGVHIGSNVKIQNNVAVYSGVEIEDDVFLGPSCVLTNVSNPRSQVVRRGLYEKTLIRRGATVGANATIVSGVTLGRYCLIAAGSVVTHDVPDYALIVGVPGRQTRWVSRHGHPLREPAGRRFHLSGEPAALPRARTRDAPLPGPRRGRAAPTGAGRRSETLSRFPPERLMISPCPSRCSISIARTQCCRVNLPRPSNVCCAPVISFWVRRSKRLKKECAAFLGQDTRSPFRPARTPSSWR